MRYLATSLSRTFATPAILLIGLILLGCTSAERETSSAERGVSYEKAVENTERLLAARVDKGIFPFAKEAREGQTTFQFIEGSREEKVDHATPLRVTIAIAQLDDGGFNLEVEANEHGLKLKKRDRDTEKRWREDLKSTIEKK